MSIGSRWRSGLVGLIAGAVAAAALLGAEPPVGAVVAPTGSTLKSSGVAPVETAGPLITERGVGEPEPQLGATVAVMPDGGVVGGRTPFLAVPALRPEKGTPSVTVPVRVMDVTSGRELAVWTGSVTDGWGRIGTTLTAGRGYRVEAQSPTEGWRQIGWFVVRGPEAVGGPIATAGGLSVSTVTGGVSWGWASESLPGPITGVGASLGWSSGSRTPRGLESVLPVGLPDGWRLAAASGSEWAGIVESGAGFVQVVSWSGTVLVFERSASGLWLQRTGGGVAGFSNDLQRAVDGSWTFTDTQGVATRFERGRAVSVTAAGDRVSVISWDASGRISRISNGVGVSMQLSYADAGVTCPSSTWTAYGFVAPPTGMLCRITYPGGVSADFGYVGGVAGAAQIGMIKNPGNDAVTLGWDSIGRLVSERSGLATRVATIDEAAKNSVSRVDFDERGRAATLRRAAAAPGAATLVTSLSFPAVTEALLKEWALSASTAPEVRGRIDYSAGRDISLSETTWFNPITWSPVRGTDVAGGEISMKVNQSNGRVQSQTDSLGRVTSYEYNSLGLVVRTTGPVEPGRGTGTSVSTDFDTDRVNGKDVALSGLRGRVTTGTQTSDEFWKSSQQRGGFSYSWSDKPAEWNGQATAVWTPADAPDRLGADSGWSFAVASSGARVQVWVGSRSCTISGGSCVIEGLPAGAKQISVSVSGARSSGWFEVKAAPVGRTPVSIPAAEVSPGYALTSVLTTNDTFAGRAKAPSTVYDYADPASGQPSAIIAPGGLKTTYAYADPWQRPTRSTSPGGAVTSMSYWPATGSATTPDVCGARTASVAGQVRTVTREDGSTATVYWDERGRVSAQVVAGGSEREIACTTYYEDNSLRSTAVFDEAGTLIERTVVEPAVGGDARVTRTTVTHGAAAPVRPGDVMERVDTVDLLGQVVTSVESFGRDATGADVVGATTVTSYTALGLPSTVTSTAPGATKHVTSYSYDPATMRLTTVRINGVVAAGLDYDSAGALAAISYPNGIATTLTYTGSGLASSVRVTGGGSVFTDSVQRTGYGRITSARLAVTGAQSFVESRAYDYDPETGRLLRATIGSTQTAMPASTVYGYRYAAAQDAICGSAYTSAGRDALRTGGSRNGTAYVTCHDAKGRATTTTDPLLTGGSGTARIEHDGLGRVTAVTGIARPLALAWGISGDLAIVQEGAGSDRVVTRSSIFNGMLVRRDVTTQSGTSRYLFTGPYALQLDDRGAISGQVSRQFSLPGGSQVTITGGAASMIVPGIDGAAIAEFRVRDLSVSGPTTATSPARFGPYGEPLATPDVTAGSALRDYGWRTGLGQETLAGASSITMIGARAYLPPLGEFLSADPVSGGGANLYSYTSGDPINSRDASGGSESWDTWDIVLAASAGLMALVSGSALVASIARTTGKGAANAVGAIAGLLGAGAATGLALKAKSDSNDTAFWVAVGVGIASAAAGAGNVINGLRPSGTWRAAAKPKTAQLTEDALIIKKSAMKVENSAQQEASSGWVASDVKAPDWVMKIEPAPGSTFSRDAGILRKIHDVNKIAAPHGEGWVFSLVTKEATSMSESAVQMMQEMGSRIGRYNNVLIEFPL